MEGIVSYGVYIPLNRMAPETKGWKTRTEKAVANFDEDSLTMGVAAAMECLKNVDRSTVDALYFATTTSPYLEKEVASTIATAVDLPREIRAADFTDSLRAGTMALRAALDAVRAGSAKRVLVVASDVRIPGAGSDFEQTFGDGAVALLIGDSQIIASIGDSSHLSDEIFDLWRADEGGMHSAEDRFAMERGYLSVVPQAVSTLLKKTRLTPKDFAKLALYAPDTRRHTQMARMLGFDPKTQVQDPMFTTVGNTGTACALMILAAALEEVKAGDKILLANYGNGADAFTLTATEEIGKLKKGRSIKEYLQSKRTLSDYQKYARWRGLIEIVPAQTRPEIPAPSTSALRRERGEVISMYGVKCKNCGYPQYPPQRICTRCHTKDNFEPYRFAEKKATLFTFAADFLADTPDPPFIVAMIDFEGGGRMKTMLADADMKELKIGAPIEMTFRRWYTAKGIHQYAWKGMPLRA